MGIESQHPDYAAALEWWQRMADVIAGQDAVHKAGTKYLPKLSEQTPQEYNAYKLRAAFFNATGRTIDALHGLMFRKPAAIDAQGMDDILGDVTMAGQSMESLCAYAGRAILSYGRVGMLVDFPPAVSQSPTVAEAVASGQRPFATMYDAMSVFNWRMSRVRNSYVLTEVRLMESYAVQLDEFTEEHRPQIRVLLLEEGQYLQRIYRKPESGSQWELVEQIVPLQNGQPLDYIPFVIIGPQKCSPEVAKPPLLDMADLNLGHYRSTADLEHGAHLTGLPMLFFAGIQLGENEKVYVGSQTAVTSPSPEADGKWIEFTGQGLEALEKRCEKKEQQMAAMGARMLAPEKRAAEASQTVEMRTGHETSMLADIAHTLTQGMTTVLGWLRDWQGAQGDATVAINTDYVVSQLSPQDITALVGAWQSGAISKQTLFWNLQQGEVVEDEVDFETEEARIGDQPPMAQPQVTAPAV